MEGVVVKHIDTQKELYYLAAVDEFSKLQGLTEDSVAFLIDHLRTVRWDELKILREQVALQGDDLNRLLSLRCPLKLNYRVSMLNTFFLNFDLTEEVKGALLDFQGDERILTKLCGTINLSPLSNELKNKLALKMLRGEYDCDELDLPPRKAALPSPAFTGSPLRKEWKASASPESNGRAGGHLLESTPQITYEDHEHEKKEGTIKDLHSPSRAYATGKRTLSDVQPTQPVRGAGTASMHTLVRRSTLPVKRSFNQGYPVKRTKVSYKERDAGSESACIRVPNSDDTQPAKLQGRYYLDESGQSDEEN